MSRPKFLADNDFIQAIIDGVLRREPSIDFGRVRDFGLERRSDPEVLEWAAQNGFIVISHDVNSMRGFAYERFARGEPMAGLFLVHQTEAIAPVIESLIVVWAGSEAEEWRDQVRYLPL
jgi:predicted nuclease of predicted toxin-antitoxin system